MPEVAEISETSEKTPRLNYVIDPNNISGNPQQFKERNKPFLEFLQSKERRILSSISRLTGFPWQDDEITINVAPWHGVKSRSYDRPEIDFYLFRGEDEVRVGIFIHELIHQSLRHPDFVKSDSSWRIPGPSGLEVPTDVTTIYVLRELFGESSVYEDEYYKWLKRTGERDPKKVNLIKYEKLMEYLPQWDLTEKPLRKYLDL